MAIGIAIDVIINVTIGIAIGIAVRIAIGVTISMTICISIHMIFGMTIEMAIGKLFPLLDSVCQHLQHRLGILPRDASIRDADTSLEIGLAAVDRCLLVTCALVSMLRLNEE